MIPLGPLRLLPHVRATEEEKDRATQGFKKDLWVIKITLTDCKWLFTSEREKTERVWQ